MHDIPHLRNGGGGNTLDAPHFRNVPFPGCGADKQNGCGAALSNFIQSIKGTFSRKMHIGHIWQRRFHDEIIQTEEQLRSVIDYIAYNPIKAGLPEKWEKHPYQYKDDDLIQNLFI
jgi:hypothetical protein